MTLSYVNRNMPKTVEESLLGDHSDQWMDSDCPEPKRIKVSATTSTHKQENVLVNFTVMCHPTIKLSDETGF